MEPSDFLSMDKDAAIGRREARITSSDTDLGVELSLLGLCFAAGGIGLATESATATVITFVLGVAIWMYLSMTPVSLQSWAQGQQAQSLAAKELKQEAKAQAELIKAQKATPQKLHGVPKQAQVSDPTSAAAAASGGAVLLPSLQQLEQLLLQLQQQQGSSIEAGRSGEIAPTRGDVEALLLAGCCSLITTEQKSSCRVTVILSPSSVSTFSSIHRLPVNADEASQEPTSSAAQASCCYILLHSETGSTAHVSDPMNVALTSMGHSMQLMGAVMGLWGQWVLLKDDTLRLPANRSLLQSNGADSYACCIKLSKIFPPASGSVPKSFPIAGSKSPLPPAFGSILWL